MKPMTPKYSAKKPAVKKLVKSQLASEADPRRYNAKTGYYGYPLQDYRGLGKTNAITQALGRKRKS